MYDAIVIGGGIVGASVGYHLARAGAKALLIDREDPGRATDAGAGIISPETSGGLLDPQSRFGVACARYYPDLVEALESTVDVDTGYARCGNLVVAFDAAERAAFSTARDRIVEQQDALGHPPEDELSEVSPDEARELCPVLGDVSAALYYEGAARVEGRRMTRALRRAGEEHGLEILSSDAERIETADGTVSGVVADGETYPADGAVVAGGAWSPAFEADLDLTLPIEPQRGQIAHFDLHGTDTADWPIVRPFREHYLVPWADGRVAAGATRESDAGFAPRTTVAGVREVLDEALRVAPGLASAELEEIRVGLRPLCADGAPVVGEAPVEGGYVATGHGPSGLTLGPYTGKVVADLVRGEPPAEDLSPFSPDRF